MKLLFLTVLKMSLISCYVILIILFVRLLLKKAPKSFSYALWLIVLIRLVCPFAPEGRISLLPRQQLQTLPATISPVQPDSASPPPIGDSSGSRSYIPAPSLSPDSREGLKVRPSLLHILFPGVASIIWGAGALLLSACLILSALRLRNSLKTARRVRDNIYEADCIKVPFAYGLFHPCIYLPPGLSPEETEFIILHEQIHIRRLDPTVKWISCLVLCIHWFNPLVWLSFRLMSRDMEMSCDERVMRELEKNGSMALSIRKAYTTSLLSLASDHTIFPEQFPGFGESGFRERIKNVLHYKKPAAFLLILAAAIITVTAAVLLVNPSSFPSSETGGLTFPHLLSKETVTLGNGQRVEVSLIMKSGRLWHSDDPDFLPGGPFHGDTVYEGQFELSVVLNGNESSVQPVTFEGENTCYFYDSVSFAFADYSGEGDPDFTLGQWAGNGANSYNLYTIRKDGTLEKLFYLPRHDSEEMSPLLEQPAPGCFLAYLYNNATGETERLLYRFAKNTFQPEEYRIEDFYDDFNQTDIVTYDTYNNYHYPLIAASEDSSVRLFGMKKGGADMGVILKGKGQTVFFDDWIYTTPRFILPRLYLADPDSDGTQEILCILNTGSGTGIYMDDLHILEPVNSRGFMDLPAHSDYLFDDIMNGLTWNLTSSGSVLELNLNGRKTSVSLDDMLDGPFAHLAFGSMTGYTYENGRIILTAWPEFYFEDFASPLFTDLTLKAEVIYDNGDYRLTDISFLTGGSNE